MYKNIKQQGGSDLSGMLKKHNEGVKFQEEYKRPPFSPYPPNSKMTQWVINHSNEHIKDKTQANYFLLGFIMVIVTISLFLVFGGETQQIEKNINPLNGNEILPGQIPGQI
jgi:hypothetical protein